MHLSIMKYRVLIVCALAVLSACTAKVDRSEVVIRDNVAYLKGSREPFTGIVQGKGKEDYRSEVCTYKKEYKGGLLDGHSKYWYPSGALESVVPYKMGQIHGIVVRYYETGKIKARIHFVDGLRGGSKGEAFWDEQGNLIK